jgi:PhnB protein
VKLNPYLSLDGNAEEAMKFYAEAFGGEVVHLDRYSSAQGMEFPEGYGDKVLHGRVKFGDNMIYFSDVAFNKTKGDTISLSVEFDNEEEIDKAYAKLSEGGAVLMPLENTFWGAKYGKVNDKYGFQWDLNYQFQPL